MKYNLFIDWFIHPTRFFTRISISFSKLSGLKKTLYFFLSYLIPIICGFELYWIWSQFAIYIISDRIISTELVLVILIGFVLILNLIILAYFHRGFKKEFRIKTFSRISIIRNNLYFIPMMIILFSMGITNISRTWNIYYLGLYLTIMAWILLLWTGYFAFSSLYSFGAEFPGTPRPIITKKQILWRILTSIALYAVFVISMTLILNQWLGAEFMPLWFKIAMFLLHGN